MNSKLFSNGLVFVNGKFKKNQILISDDIIMAVGNRLSVSEDTEIIDCAGKRIIPGLIDIHTHGCNGYDFSTASLEQIYQMLQWYAERGITTVLPTTMTDATKNMMQAMKNLHAVYRGQRQRKTPEAHMAGIRMEGPFFGKEKKGAHNEAFLQPISEELFRNLFLACGGFLNIVDIDPTLPGAFDFINNHRKDFIISLGHTTCSYETAKQAYLAGVTHITHLFNAMNGMHHREPGLIGALYDFGFYADIICDGIHIHPSVLRMMFSAVPEKLVLISDSMSAAGLDDGKYQLGGHAVAVKGGHATLADGTIAGSTTNVYDSMRNLIHYGVPATAAIAAATESAALSAGISKRYGFIKKGRAADLLLLDIDYQLEQVWIGGELYHSVRHS